MLASFPASLRFFWMEWVETGGSIHVGGVKPPLWGQGAEADVSCPLSPVPRSPGLHLMPLEGGSRY